MWTFARWICNFLPQYLLRCCSPWICSYSAICIVYFWGYLVKWRYSSRVLLMCLCYLCVPLVLSGCAGWMILWCGGCGAYLWHSQSWCDGPLLPRISVSQMRFSHIFSVWVGTGHSSPCYYYSCSSKRNGWLDFSVRQTLVSGISGSKASCRLWSSQLSTVSICPQK